MRKFALVAALIGALTSCNEAPTAPLPVDVSPPSSMSSDVSQVTIPGSYIVRFRAGSVSALSSAMTVSNLYGGTVDRVYTSAINGAAMQLADDAAAALRADPNVLSVEPNVEFRMSATTQLGATWGLDRLDQRTRPLSGTYVYGATGAGVTVYIIDTGINFGQPDFGGRAQSGFDAITNGGTAVDCEGHGSHVAGTVGSTTYGVAKGVRLVAVRVLNCSGIGNSASVLAGIDWVTKNKSLPAVVNMSIGSGFNPTVNLAVQNSIAAGITYVVSAGNASTDACWQSPAAAPDALTIASSDASDGFAGFSNFGTCVDLIAPGVGITSWWTGSGSNTLSGTSMSSPHVAGAAALYLQTNPTATPAQVRAALVGNATSGIVSGVPSGTPNLLLYTGFIGGGSPPPPAPPVANFTTSCTANTCSFDASSSTSAGTPSFQWTFGDASSGTGKTTSHSYAVGGTYAVTLTVTDANGSNAKTANVAINRAPTAAIVAPANNATFNQGASVNFNGTASDPEDGALSGASLVWTSSRDGAIGTGSSVTTATLSVGVHVITLTAKDAQNATDAKSISITIKANQSPTATISAPANNASATQGASVTFSGTGADAEDGALSGASLVWSSNRDGQIGTGVTFAKNNLSVGAHTITLTAKDSKGATGVATITLTINSPANQLPTALISAPANNASATQGASVTFSGTGADAEDGALSGASLVWSSNRDGQIGMGVTFAKTNLSVGTHTITLTAKDSKGATGTATITLTINVPANQLPTAAIVTPANNASFLVGTSVSFTGSGTDPEDGALNGGSLVWTSNRDGQIGTGASFSTNNLTLGAHTITLTAKDSKGATGVATRTITIVPNQPPTATISAPANNANATQGANVTFSGSATDPEDGVLSGSSLVWTSSRDGQIGTGGGFVKSNLSVGTHTITLTAKDSKGATDVETITLTVSVPVNQLPTATIATPANNASVAPGTSVAFSGSGNDPEDGTLGGGSLVWTSSLDGQIGTGASFTKANLSVGKHTITLTAKDSKGATGTATRTLTVATNTVNTAPTASITAPAAFSNVSQGSALTFSGSGMDAEDGPLSGASLVWTSNRDGQIGTGTTFTKSNLTLGTHTITLTAKDAQGATSSTARAIIVSNNRPPVASFTLTCTGHQCTFDASASTDDVGVTEYNWTWGDGTTTVSATSNAVHSFPTTNSYTMTLMVRDVRGASQGITRVVAVP